MHELTAGGLEGLADQPFGTMDTQALIVAMTALGDAVRLGMPVPSALLQRVTRELTQAQIEGVFTSLKEEVVGWALPRKLGDDDDPMLEWAIGRRDEIESVLIGARRIFMPRGVFIDASAQAQSLAVAITQRDLTCGGSLFRSDAERLLGQRLELVAERSWLDKLNWAAESESTSPDASPPEQLGLGRPSFESFARYVVTGELATWVETAANRSSDVAAELEDVVATYREQGNVLSLLAARWMRNRQARTGEPKPPIAFRRVRLSEQRFAAADQEATAGADAHERNLGVLAPLDAEARFVETDRTLTLEVFEGKTTLKSVSLDGVLAERPANGHTWSITIPWVQRDRAVKLQVVDVTGNAFEESIAWTDE